MQCGVALREWPRILFATTTPNLFRQAVTVAIAHHERVQGRDRFASSGRGIISAGSRIVAHETIDQTETGTRWLTMFTFVLSVHLDVDDVTSDEVRCYRLLKVQLSRGTFKISVIVPARVSSLDIIHPFCEVIQISLSHCDCFAIM